MIDIARKFNQLVLRYIKIRIIPTIKWTHRSIILGTSPPNSYLNYFESSHSCHLFPSPLLQRNINNTELITNIFVFTIGFWTAIVDSFLIGWFFNQFKNVLSAHKWSTFLILGDIIIQVVWNIVIWNI